MQRFIFLLPVLGCAVPVCGQTASGGAPALTPAEGQAMVVAALANELKAAQDATHPMCYQLHKTSPRLTTTKKIVETRDGLVARLTSINDKPLSAADEQKEDARLYELLTDPGRQRRRKQAEDADADRALKVLRALPAAFLYHYDGAAEGPTGTVQKFTFRPNPDFSPPDLETEVLTEMSGDLWIDVARMRVARLDGRLEQDVDFGWGILGRLNRGGWITIDQADVGDGNWRIVHFQMAMSGRVVFRSRVFDTMEDESRFSPLPVGMSYQKAIEMLREDPKINSK